MKPLTSEEEILVAEQLAKMPTETTRTMKKEESQSGIWQMMRDLRRLASEDGCIAAGWALDFVITQAVIANTTQLGNIIPHNWQVFQMTDDEFWAGPDYETTAEAYRRATGEDGIMGPTPISLDHFEDSCDACGSEDTPESVLLRYYLDNTPHFFGGIPD